MRNVENPTDGAKNLSPNSKNQPVPLYMTANKQHFFCKCCVQNWANNLPMNVVKELMGHSSIATTQKFYNQVDDNHRAKAAAVIDMLVSGTDAENEKQYKTDARLTPSSNFSENGSEKRL